MKSLRDLAWDPGITAGRRFRWMRVPRTDQSTPQRHFGRLSIRKIGRAARGSWDFRLGPSGLSKISEETGAGVFLGEPAHRSICNGICNRCENPAVSKFPAFQSALHQKPDFDQSTFRLSYPHMRHLLADDVSFTGIPLKNPRLANTHVAQRSELRPV